MKAFDIIDALQETDETFLEEAARMRVKPRRRRMLWLPPVLVAACVTLIMIVLPESSQSINDASAPAAADVKTEENVLSPAESQEQAEQAYFLIGTYTGDLTELPICSHRYGEPELPASALSDEETERAADEAAVTEDKTDIANASENEQMYPLLPVADLAAEAEKDGRKIVEINIVYSIYPLDHQVPYYQFIDENGESVYIKAIDEPQQ